MSVQAGIEASQRQRVFRWLNFGSCTMRYAFDTPEFSKGSFHGLPLQVSKVWRREIGALMSDWEVASGFSADLPPSQFSEAWLSSKAIFQNADVVLVDLALDIFRDQSLRFARPGETDFVRYKGVISNFPEELPESLEAEVGVFPCSAASAVAAWERFGREVATPTVFVTYEKADHITPGYGEAYRKRVLDYQDAVCALAPQFPHWLVIDMDELFAPYGHDCYIDRHHPTELGWKVLREETPRLILEKGLIRPNPGGAPLPIGTKYIPERCDFDVLDLKHMKLLSELDVPACAVGPSRLTRTAKAAFHPKPLDSYTSFGAFKDKQPSLIIVLKWDQPIKLPPWISGLMKQHPGAVIEMPCLWKGREKFLVSEDELALRQQLKRFGAENGQADIDCSAVPPARFMYVARCLLKTHRVSAGSVVLRPAVGASSGAKPLPEPIAAALASSDLAPVFCPHS